jgi:hypothetical protein
MGYTTPGHETMAHAQNHADCILGLKTLRILTLSELRDSNKAGARSKPAAL